MKDRAAGHDPGGPYPGPRQRAAGKARRIIRKRAVSGIEWMLGKQ